jgi:hypothetical protein
MSCDTATTLASITWPTVALAFVVVAGLVAFFWVLGHFS